MDELKKRMLPEEMPNHVLTRLRHALNTFDIDQAVNNNFNNNNNKTSFNGPREYREHKEAFLSRFRNQLSNEDDEKVLLLRTARCFNNPTLSTFEFRFAKSDGSFEVIHVVKSFLELITESKFLLSLLEDKSFHEFDEEYSRQFKEAWHAYLGFLHTGKLQDNIMRNMDIFSSLFTLVRKVDEPQLELYMQWFLQYRFYSTMGEHFSVAWSRQFTEVVRKFGSESTIQRLIDASDDIFFLFPKNFKYYHTKRSYDILVSFFTDYFMSAMQKGVSNRERELLSFMQGLFHFTESHSTRCHSLKCDATQHEYDWDAFFEVYHKQQEVVRSTALQWLTDCVNSKPLHQCRPLISLIHAFNLPQVSLLDRLGEKLRVEIQFLNQENRVISCSGRISHLNDYVVMVLQLEEIGHLGIEVFDKLNELTQKVIEEKKRCICGTTHELDLFPLLENTRWYKKFGHIFWKRAFELEMAHNPERTFEYVKTILYTTNHNTDYNNDHVIQVHLLWLFIGLFRNVDNVSNHHPNWATLDNIQFVYIWHPLVPNDIDRKALLDALLTRLNFEFSHLTASGESLVILEKFKQLLEQQCNQI